MISIVFTVIFFLPPTAALAEATPVHEIQGGGDESSMVGLIRTVQGAAVGDFQGDDELKGFFLQEEFPDDDPATSEGVFVYHNQTDVRIGDRVRLTGEVKEYKGLTEITAVRDLSILQSGVALPAPVELTLPLSSIAGLERYEGMRVVLPQRLTVSDISALPVYGSVVLSRGRPMKPTAAAPPGPQSQAVADANRLNRLILDDGSTRFEPVPIPYPSPGMTADRPLRTGYAVTGLIGVLDFSFGEYRFHPTEPVVFETDANLRRDGPVVPAGRLRAAGFNLQNYFNGPEFPTSRGAATSEAFARQHAKITAALAGMAADVVGLMEMENDGYGPESAIAQLTDGLNAAAPKGTSYDYIRPETDRLGNDAIANCLIFRRETVAPAGPASALTSGAFAGTSRPPLAQSFREIATGETFTVVVNHFRSRSTPCEGDPEEETYQGPCNGERTRAAKELVAWLETAPYGADDPDILIIGDLNAYAFEDPLTVLREAAYVDLLQSHIGSDVYTYVYDGAAGALDHALASPSMASQIHNAAVWRINSDEPSILDYTTLKRTEDGAILYDPGPFRSSDHDPVIVSIDPGGVIFHLGDVLSALRITAGFTDDPASPILDLDGNHRIGLEDVVGLLRHVIAE